MQKPRRIAWLLVLSLALGLSVPAFAAEDAATALPSVGETVEGFTVRENGSFDLLDAPTVLLEHDKTGALVYYIAADDVNRSFDITFRTPTMDNRGIPHVFEHVTISGSENYPSGNLFFPIINQTYNTFANAMTMWNATTYPVASLSEDQLLKLMDVYLDGVFNPMIYDDDRVFRREAWRYELADADDELTITGTVYNEMKGARTISRVANLNALTLLYPDSMQGYDAGGDPAEIPNITYQDLLDFHDAYYHPSNALVILYGDLDLARVLRMMDADYFSHYERKEIDVPNGDMPPQTDFVQAEFAFPVETGSPVDGGSILNYGFVANGADFSDEMALNVLASVLSHQASPLQVAVRERMPGASVNVSVDVEYPQTMVMFTATGVDREDGDTFKALVDETMAQIAQDGLDADLVQAVVSTLRFSMLTLPEMSNLGTSISPSLAMIWARNGNIEYFNDYLFELERQQSFGDDTSVYLTMIDRYILQNGHAALAVTYPEPGLIEQQAEALAQKLADYKASLSDDAIESLVEDAAEMVAFSAEEAPQEMIQSLQAVTVQTLPEEIDLYEIEDVTRDGVRYVTAPTQAGDIGLTQIVLDTSWVPAEDLGILTLYASLVGSLDTQTHSKEELSLLNTRYLNGLATSATQVEEAGEVYRPVFNAQWMGLMDDYATGVALVHEILFETKFDNVADIQNVISMSKTNTRQMLASAPYMYQMYRAYAAFKDEGVYQNYTVGLDAYYTLLEIEQQLQENPDEVIQALEEMQDALQNKANAIAVFTGNASAVEIFKTDIVPFFAEMEETTREEADYSGLPRPAMHEALVVDSQVQYNLVYAPLELLDVTYSGILDPLSQVLYDGYLTPNLRHGLGAYGVMTYLDRDGFLISSYRDPAIAESYEVLAGMGTYLETVEMAQEDLDRFIISAYSSYAMPLGNLNGAAYALTQHLSGRPADEKLQHMQEMKAMTIEDLRAMAPVLTQLYEEGVHSTAGGAAIIDENKDLFDEILRVE